jgi:hypothetical protein
VIGIGSSLVGLITGGGGVVASLGALLNPVGLVVAAVAGLGLAWATDFGGIRTTTIEVTEQAASTISTWAANTVTKFGETQTQIGTTLAGWSTSLGTTLSDLSSQTGSTLATWASGVTQRFNTLRTDSQNAFSGMSSSIQSSATNLAAQSLIAIRRFETEGGPIFTKFRESAVNKIGEMVRDVPMRLRELVDAGLRVFDVGKWIQAGADVIGGVLRGLQNAATAPLRWIENFAGGLVSVFKSVLKIASPSQVFYDASVDIMDGALGGLEDRSGAVLGFMNQFSRDLVETSAAAQRLADAEFKKLTDSATAAYNGFVATANSIATLSQNIDAAAIAAQNAAQQAYVDSLAPTAPAAPAAPAADSGFGTGRVAELTSQITRIVRTSFEAVGNAGIRSLGIDLRQFQSASQVESAIAQLRLLAGTIQQNAQVAPNVNDRNRLQSLFSDLSSRILPLLTNDLARRQANEQAAQAAAAEAAKPQTIRALEQSIKGIVEYVGILRNVGLTQWVSPVEITADIQSVFTATSNGVRLVASGLDREIQALNQNGVGMNSDALASTLTRIGDILSKVSEVTDALQGTSLSSLDDDSVNQRLFSSLTSSFLEALPALASSSTQSQTNVNVGSINNGMDIAALQALIRQAVAEALP